MSSLVDVKRKSLSGWMISSVDTFITHKKNKSYFDIRYDGVDATVVATTKKEAQDKWDEIQQARLQPRSVIIKESDNVKFVYKDGVEEIKITSDI